MGARVALPGSGRCRRQGARWEAPGAGKAADEVDETAAADGADTTGSAAADAACRQGSAAGSGAGGARGTAGRPARLRAHAGPAGGPWSPAPV